ncbi:MAG: hypothetical protein WEE50_07710 [Chloroflexota bacterium]
MHRRPLGRGRTLAALASPFIVIGCVLPWWRVGGTPGITESAGNGFEGSGILVFLVGIVTLALVALPYAAGDRPLALDRWLSFAVLAVAGWIGLAWQVLQLTLIGAFQFHEPTEVLTNGPGVWLAGVGLVVLSRAVYEMASEPTRR